MSHTYFLLDVFAEAPFQGIQVPVVITKAITGGQTLTDEHKKAIASAFPQTDTVFIDPTASENQASVFDSKGPCRFGAHTILAASYAAYDKGLTQDDGAYTRFLIRQTGQDIESFIDKTDSGPGAIQFKRTLASVQDRYTPEVPQLAAALNLDERHISFSKYKPMVVSVDHPVLIVPLTRPEHVLSASFNREKWAELAGLVYTSQIFLFAPGSLTGRTQFHGRLLSPELGRDVFPPIGNVMPEFIAYLAEQDGIAEGTHTFAIDRGSEDTRQSVLHAEFDKRAGREPRCRIGGHVIKMGTGELLYP